MITVDLRQRTITGLAVPYNVTGVSRWRRRYAPGSVRWHGARVPLLVEHVWSRRVGWSVELAETDAGLAAVFAVAYGLAGDRALAAAADGTLRGLSPGADLLASTPYREERGVTLVVAAELREVSLTATPSFDLTGAGAR